MVPPEDSTGPESRPRLTGRSAFVIAAYGIILLLLRFGPAWVLTYHEAFYCEPAREFLLTGDFLVPRIAGDPSWQKPPLTLWAIAGSLELFDTEAEWAARLPINLCAIVNACLIAFLAARWFGDRMGRIAGLLQMTSIYVLFQARLAEPDMVFCTTVTAAITAFARGALPGPNRALAPRLWPWALPFGTAAGLAVLTKGPLGVAFIAGACGLYALTGRSRRAWRLLLHPVAIASFLIVALPWYLLAYLRDPAGVAEFLLVHNLGRFRGTLGGDEGPFFYLYAIPGLLLPWTILVITGTIRLNRERPQPLDYWRLLACWFGFGLLLISASSWKHKHYAIPILPPLSIVAAFGLERLLYRMAWRPPRALLFIVAGAIAASGLLVCAIATSRYVPIVIQAAPAGSLIALGLLGMALARRNGRGAQAEAFVFATMLAVNVHVQSVVLPSFDLYREQAELAQRTNARLGPSEPLLLYRVPEPQVLYYLRHPLELYKEREDLLGRLAEIRGPVWVVVPFDAVAELRELGAVALVDQAPTLARLTTVRFEPVPERVALARRADATRRAR